MGQYELLRLAGDGEIRARAEFSASSDDAAIDFAISRAGLDDLEVWKDGSFVALITRDEPAGTSRPSAA